MISTQNLSFAFGRVLNRRVERSVSVTGLAMIFLLTGFSHTILDNACTLAFGAAIYSYLSYHVLRIPSVTLLPLPRIDP